MLLTTVAFTVDRYQEIGVFFGSVNKVFINGDDKTNEFKEPFVYNNTTYVSLRDVAEALGQEVHWDAKTESIYIGERPVTLTIDETDLLTKNIIATNSIFLYRMNNNAAPYYNLDKDAGFTYDPYYKMRIMTDPKGVASTEYQKGISIKLYDDYSAIFYSLNGQYDVFKGLIGFDYPLNNGKYTDYHMNVIVDKKIIKTIKLSTENVYEEFEVSVIGGNELKLEFVRPNNNDLEPFINIVNPVLEQHIYN